jgi:hypothetical protein
MSMMLAISTRSLADITVLEEGQRNNKESDQYS